MFLMVVSFKDVGIVVNGFTVPVGTANLSLEAQIEPRRNIYGFANFNQSAPMQNTFTLEGVLSTGWLPLLALTGESTGVSLNIGGALFTGVHIEQIKIKGAVYEVLTVEVDMKSWCPPSGLISGSIVNVVSAPFAHASQSIFSVGVADNPYEFDYSLQMERIPRFPAGSITPDAVRLARFEKEIQFRAGNFSQFVSYSGAAASASLDLYCPTGFVYNIAVSGNINQQSVQIDDLGVANMNIRQFLR